MLVKLFRLIKVYNKTKLTFWILVRSCSIHKSWFCCWFDSCLMWRNFSSFTNSNSRKVNRCCFFWWVRCCFSWYYWSSFLLSCSCCFIDYSWNSFTFRCSTYYDSWFVSSCNNLFCWRYWWLLSWSFWWCWLICFWFENFSVKNLLELQNQYNIV